MRIPIGHWPRRMDWETDVTVKHFHISLCLIIAGCGKQVGQPVDEIVSQPEVVEIRAPRFDPAKISFAEAELRKEPKIIDLLHDDSNVVEWVIAVKDDGSKRFGYAGYVCLKLREFGVYDDQLEVRIVDIAKQAEFRDAYREYDLGTVRCVDEQPFSG